MQEVSNANQVVIDVNQAKTFNELATYLINFVDYAIKNTKARNQTEHNLVNELNKFIKFKKPFLTQEISFTTVNLIIDELEEKLDDEVNKVTAWFKPSKDTEFVRESALRGSIRQARMKVTEINTLQACGVRIDSLEKNVEKLDKDNKKLTNENEKLTEEKNILEKDKQVLVSRNQHLEAENNQLIVAKDGAELINEYFKKLAQQGLLTVDMNAAQEVASQFGLKGNQLLEYIPKNDNNSNKQTQVLSTAKYEYKTRPSAVNKEQWKKDHPFDDIKLKMDTALSKRMFYMGYDLLEIFHMKTSDAQPDGIIVPALPTARDKMNIQKMVSRIFNLSLVTNAEYAQSDWQERINQITLDVSADSKALKEFLNGISIYEKNADDKLPSRELTGQTGRYSWVRGLLNGDNSCFPKCSDIVSKIDAKIEELSTTGKDTVKVVEVPTTGFGANN